MKEIQEQASLHAHHSSKDNKDLVKTPLLNPYHIFLIFLTHTTPNTHSKHTKNTHTKSLKMALRMWASSTANALKLSTATRPHFSPLSRCFSSVLDGLKYANSHEWVKHEGSVATIGITDHAQDHLGEVVFVDLPETGGSVTKATGFGAVESVKATSDINSPISGEIVEVNSKLTDTPGLINTSPYEDGWMIKVKPSNPSELESLMGSKEYTKFCEEEDASH